MTYPLIQNLFSRLPIVGLFVAAVLATGLVIGCDSDDDGDETELIFAFQPQENPEGLQLDAEKLGEFITEQTGYQVDIRLPTNYAAVVEALRSENADVAYFSGLPYMMAHEMAGAELLVVEERDGEPFYYSQWYTLEDEDIDELADLQDRSIAFTARSSTSGYLFPMAEAIEQGLVEQHGDPNDFFANVVYAGGYQQALQALLNGQVAAAAASDYALRTYLTEEQRERIKVITEQGPVPTHGLAIRGDIDPEIKDAVRQALLQLNDEQHSDLLRSVYGAERLVEVDHDDHVKALSRAYELVNFDEDI